LLLGIPLGALRWNSGSGGGLPDGSGLRRQVLSSRLQPTCLLPLKP